MNQRWSKTTLPTLSIIGAGSNYVPVLIHSMLEHFEKFPFSKIVLMDVSDKRLEVIANYVQFQFKGTVAVSSVFNEDTDTALKIALQNADVIFTIYRVGGLEGREWDTKKAIEYDMLGQETQGWGGFASALRNIPVATRICEILNQMDSSAWLINITNPTGIVTQACYKVRPRYTVGICEVSLLMRRTIAKHLKMNLEEFEVCYLGLNHLSWITDIINKTDKSSLFDNILEDEVLSVFCEDLYGDDFSDGISKKIKELSAIPSPYLRYYYFPDKTKRMQEYRAQECIEIDKKLMKQFYLQFDRSNWLTEAKKRGGYLLGETVAILVEQILFDMTTRKTIFPCIRNGDCLPFLSPEVIVEVPVKVQKDEFTCEIDSILSLLDEKISEHIKHIADYECLVVEAAMEGNKKKALEALRIHPLISYEAGSKLIAKMLTKYQKLVNERFFVTTKVVAK